MGIGKRIKYLRKDKLNLTQAKFGERIGLKATAIGQMESGDRNVTDRTIILICNEFNINEKWLRTGEGEMFVEENSAIISELASEYNLDSKGIKFIEAFLNLTSEQRAALQELAINFSKAITKDDEITATKEIDTNSIDYEVEAYRAELIAESKGEISSVSENSKEKNLA